MLDGLVLQIVLTVLVIIAAAVAAVWFIAGLTQKSAVWIVALAVPLAAGVASLGGCVITTQLPRHAKACHPFASRRGIIVSAPTGGDLHHRPFLRHYS